MPRVYYVKKARKDNSAVKAGESYYWWKPRYGGKRYSATRPRPSQLCSGRKSEVMAAQESLQDALDGCTDGDSIREACEECAEQLRDLGREYEESADNMPESLQYGEQAENMREMAMSLDSAADELEGLDFDLDDPPDRDDFDDEDDFDLAHEEWETTRDNLVDEANEAANTVEFMF